MRRAAELAYYFLLMFFPMLIVAPIIINFLPGLQDELLVWLARVIPSLKHRVWSSNG